jgi:hypothetical protein
VGATRAARRRFAGPHDRRQIVSLAGACNRTNASEREPALQRTRGGRHVEGDRTPAQRWRWGGKPFQSRPLQCLRKSADPRRSPFEEESDGSRKPVPPRGVLVERKPRPNVRGMDFSYSGCDDRHVSSPAARPPEALLQEVVSELRKDAAEITLDKHKGPASSARRKVALEMLALEIEDVRGRLLAAPLDLP